MMTVRLGVALVTVSMCTHVAAVAQQKPVYGGATPQEVIGGIQKAGKAGDFPGVVRYVSPSGRTELVKEGLIGLMFMFALSDPDDPMPGSKPLAKAELETKRKNYRAARDIIVAALKPYGLESLVDQSGGDAQKTLDAAIAKADSVAMVTSLMNALDRVGPLLGMTKSEKPKVPFLFENVTDYQIKGDRATAKSGTETLDFIRLDGRWYINPPPKPAK